MTEEKQPPHDLEAHPWLLNFDKKNDREKISLIIERLKCLENLVGTISIIVLFSGAAVATLMVISMFAGNFNLGTMISIIKGVAGG